MLSADRDGPGAFAEAAREAQRAVEGRLVDPSRMSPATNSRRPGAVQGLEYGRVGPEEMELVAS